MTTSSPFYSVLFTIFTLNFFSGFQVYAVPYDYSYTLGCVPKPEAPQYNGGMVVNPEFNDGLKGWTAVGGAKIENAKSPDGNNYVVVSNRNVETDGLSQTFNMEKDKFYTVSAWVQVSKEKAKVQARMHTASGRYLTANWITAQSGCWSMIKGGLMVNTTGPADLHFETNITGVDIWVDSVSVQPFTQEEWKSHQDDNREKARKTKVKFEAVDANGQPVANATVSIRQREPNFPFGASINEFIIDNPVYQKWFLDRFKYTVFDNELKWAVTEEVPGVENYTLADKMVEFCKSNGITARGHNILWDDTKFQMEWILKLTPEELQKAALKRVNSVVSRYKGEFIQWDVINENMHWDLFSKLQPGTYAASIFNLTHQIDPSSTLFLNDYNVIEDSSVYGKATPGNYLAKIDELRHAGYTGPLGIGLESHFDSVVPNIPYVRASLDMLAATGLPIWITEFDVSFEHIPNPGATLELLMRELHSHAAVSGIIVWSAWAPTKGCWAMCTRTPDYSQNTLAGDLVDKFLYEFIKVADSYGTTDGSGAFEASLYHGEYEVKVTLPSGALSTISQTFSLVPNGNVTTVQLKSNSFLNSNSCPIFDSIQLGCFVIFFSLFVSYLLISPKMMGC